MELVLNHIRTQAVGVLGLVFDDLVVWHRSLI